eukprot:TRINITY_DN6370_c0_g1_i3.p1 TRINITY_DN6370_c0_g1~~TRINITY_DN6370_c0_g1_i3.p1  ORF type:complete len:277 (+),score=26.26 TRINITY_DN6370_c0_g1_i3:367-1197(+)
MEQLQIFVEYLAKITNDDYHLKNNYASGDMFTLYKDVAFSLHLGISHQQYDFSRQTLVLKSKEDIPWSSKSCVQRNAIIVSSEVETPKSVWIVRDDTEKINGYIEHYNMPELATTFPSYVVRVTEVPPGFEGFMKYIEFELETKIQRDQHTTDFKHLMGQQEKEIFDDCIYLSLPAAILFTPIWIVGVIFVLLFNIAKRCSMTQCLWSFLYVLVLGINFIPLLLLSGPVVVITTFSKYGVARGLQDLVGILHDELFLNENMFYKWLRLTTGCEVNK